MTKLVLCGVLAVAMAGTAASAMKTTASADGTVMCEPVSCGIRYVDNPALRPSVEVGFGGIAPECDQTDQLLRVEYDMAAEELLLDAIYGRSMPTTAPGVVGRPGQAIVSMTPPAFDPPTTIQASRPIWTL
jgi:hypothetical protein